MRNICRLEKRMTNMPKITFLIVRNVENVILHVNNREKQKAKKVYKKIPVNFSVD